MSPEAEAEEAAATKIQAVFRGNKAREELAPKQNQIRKIIARKIMKGNNRYYMVTVYDQESNYKIELNPADDPELPMFETLHTLNVAKGEIDEIFKNLQILTGNKLSYSKDAIKEEGKSNDKKQVARSTTRGGLMIEIVNSTNVKSAYISCQYSEIYAHSTAGPPWSRKIVLQDIEIPGKVLPLDLKLFALETRTEIASGSVDWSHAVTLPDT